MNKFNRAIKINIVLVVLSGLFFGSQYSIIHAQHVPVHVSNSGIYNFLDELAATGVIDINTAIKPYSRLEISTFLEQANSNHSLSRRQQQEVDFYLRDFGKELSHQKPTDKRFDLFYYTDSLFRITINPIIGFELNKAGSSNAIHRTNGGEFHGTIGKHFGFYGSLRDNYESKIMSGPDFLVNRRGAIYKGDEEEHDYSEAYGGMTWTWKWGKLGLHKNHYIWGNGYHGANIFSGNTPSHAFISLNISPVNWMELQYMHGWLVSEVVDSARTFKYYDGNREVFSDKYIAANLLTVKPVPRVHISLGNSIIYADTRINPAFLVPFLFYKSVDHTYNGASNEVGHNSQMFLDISTRQINHLHVYGTLFVDEISFNRMFKAEEQSNYISIKTGARLTGIPPGFVFTAEYTRTNPMVYQHIIPTTTWETNNYNMGHHMKDNSDELFLSLQYKPIRGLLLELSHTQSRKGKDYQSILAEGNESLHSEINQEEPRWGIPFMNEVKWKQQKTSVKGSWQIIHDGYVYLSFYYQDFGEDNIERYTPPFYREGGFGGQVGINYGF